MKRERPYDAVLFDVDGTLIDSNSAHAEAWTRALNEHGIAAEVAQVRRFVGMGGDKLLPAVARIEEGSELARAVVKRKQEIFDAVLSTLQPTTGARLLLEYLRDQQVDLVIATSAQERELNAILERAGVQDLFEKRTTKDDAHDSKPDPDIVAAALRKTRASRMRTVMVGDTPYDVEAATGAGIGTIALRSGGYWSDRDLAGALAIFDDPASLKTYWQSIHETGPGLASAFH